MVKQTIEPIWDHPDRFFREGSGRREGEKSLPQSTQSTQRGKAEGDKEGKRRKEEKWGEDGKRERGGKRRDEKWGYRMRV